ncbi:hypothetical protein E2C01_085047 [Portunus trituberculatus]|uniref:Uncharacterized protein n=1 Tax=Portunus trituberculatus TaxID=210409 RepID=A0A5B7IZX8_PORTR|nr:hypothetical protein [Portunus trituberculatus]
MKTFISISPIHQHWNDRRPTHPGRRPFTAKLPAPTHSHYPPTWLKEYKIFTLYASSPAAPVNIQLHTPLDERNLSHHTGETLNKPVLLSHVYPSLPPSHLSDITP